jgi:thiamine biosynthesis lipoprotein
MGCDVAVSDGDAVEDVRALFDARDRRFSRFNPSSELNRVNAVPLGLTLLSEEFASMAGLALDAARATGGMVSPCVGGAVLAAGYDRDFAQLPPDGDAVEPARVPRHEAISLLGRMILRAEPVLLDLNGVVKGRTVDDALALLDGGFVSAGGDVATSVPIVVGLPGGETATLHRGGLATSSVSRRRWLRGGSEQHHLIDPRTGAPAETPWRDVSVAARSCFVADVAAKAALLLGEAGPAWLDARGLAGRFVGRDGAVVCSAAWRAGFAEAAAA